MKKSIIKKHKEKKRIRSSYPRNVLHPKHYLISYFYLVSPGVLMRDNNKEEDEAFIKWHEEYLNDPEKDSK